MQLPEQHVEWGDHRDLGEHPDRENEPEKQGLPPKLEPRQRIRAQGTDRDAEGGGGSRHDQRIPNRYPEVPLGKECPVVLQHQVRRKQGRALEQASLGSERGQNCPIEWKGAGPDQERER
jgi:hypothetical protein